MKRMLQGQAEEMRGQIRRTQSGAVTSAPVEPVPGSATPPQAANSESPEAVEMLKGLAALRDQGILSEEEFAAKKQQILQQNPANAVAANASAASGASESVSSRYAVLWPKQHATTHVLVIDLVQKFAASAARKDHVHLAG